MLDENKPLKGTEQNFVILPSRQSDSTLRPLSLATLTLGILKRIRFGDTVLQNMTWLVCRNIFPFFNCMMRIFCFSFQTHFALFSPNSCLTFACYEVDLYGHSGLVNIPGSAPLPCLLSEWCGPSEVQHYSEDQRAGRFLSP